MSLGLKEKKRYGLAVTLKYTYRCQQAAENQYGIQDSIWFRERFTSNTTIIRQTRNPKGSFLQHRDASQCLLGEIHFLSHSSMIMQYVML